MKLVLHLGAHKTATTHIQSRLYNSREILGNNGVLFIGPEETRKTDDLCIGEKVAGISKRYRRVIVSDENILGLVKQFRNTQIYPQAGKKVHRILKTSGCNDVDIYLTIRTPEEYLVSRYIEYLRHFPFVGFHEYIHALDVEQFTWVPLVRELERASRNTVKVHLFESLFDEEESYFSALTGIDGVRLNEATEGQDVKRSKISLEAYRVLVCAAENFAQGTTQHILEILDRASQSTKPTPLRFLDKETSRKLRKNYENDIKVLDMHNREPCSTFYVERKETGATNAVGALLSALKRYFR